MFEKYLSRHPSWDDALKITEWIRESAVALKGVTAGVGFEDLVPLGHWLAAARVVGLGEATHGTREFFQLKQRLLEFLVSELGFTIFAIEADLPQSLAINRYVLTGEGDARHSLNSLRYWDAEEVLELIEWMRRWNIAHERQVYFYGVDAQSTAPAIFLLAYLRNHDPPAHDRVRQALLPLTTEANSYLFECWVTLPQAQRAAARAAVGDVLATLAAMQAEDATARYELGIARLQAAMLFQNTQQWDLAFLPEGQSIRDRAMADNLAALLDLHGATSKAVFWAHNGHVQLRPGDPWGGKTPPAGQHLRGRFGAAYFSVGLLFDHGSFEAPDQDYRKHAWTVGSGVGTLDATLAGAGLPLFGLDLRSVPQGAADWFAQAPASRCIGGGFRPSWEQELWTKVDARELFDAVLFVRETSAARPNPGAYDFDFRREEPAAAGGWVNLDFSRGTTGWRMRPQLTVGAYKLSANSSGGSLEISRAESLWPWDNFSLSQTVPAESCRGKNVTVRCEMSMQAAHDGSSAQLAIRVLRRRRAPTGDSLEQLSAEMHEGCWLDRLVWQRAVTRDADAREILLTTRIPEDADTISIALIIAGDGLARFGPVRITADPAHSKLT